MDDESFFDEDVDIILDDDEREESSSHDDMPAQIGLFPCPFCGAGIDTSSSKPALRSRGKGVSTRWFVRCVCGISTDDKFTKPESAVAFWNTRSDGKECQTPDDLDDAYPALKE